MRHTTRISSPTISWETWDSYDWILRDHTAHRLPNGFAKTSSEAHNTVKLFLQHLPASFFFLRRNYELPAFWSDFLLIFPHRHFFPIRVLHSSCQFGICFSKNTNSHRWEVGNKVMRFNDTGWCQSFAWQICPFRCFLQNHWPRWPLTNMPECYFMDQHQSDVQFKETHAFRAWSIRPVRKEGVPFLSYKSIDKLKDRQKWAAESN